LQVLSSALPKWAPNSPKGSCDVDVDTVGFGTDRIRLVHRFGDATHSTRHPAMKPNIGRSEWHLQTGGLDGSDLSQKAETCERCKDGMILCRDCFLAPVGQIGSPSVHRIAWHGISIGAEIWLHCWVPVQIDMPCNPAPQKRLPKARMGLDSDGTGAEGACAVTMHLCQ
jgi:hypothetical protein